MNESDERIQALEGKIERLERQVEWLKKQITQPRSSNRRSDYRDRFDALDHPER